MTSQELDERLRSRFKVTLDELVEDVRRQLLHRNAPPAISLEQIHQGILGFYGEHGRRPQVGKGGMLCGKNLGTVDRLCHMHHGTTLQKEVMKVLGDPNKGWRDKLHTVIRDYWSRGVRITCKTGYVPEMDMSGNTINSRLRSHHNSNLTKEFLNVIGVQSGTRNGSHRSHVNAKATAKNTIIRSRRGIGKGNNLSGSHS